VFFAVYSCPSFEHGSVGESARKLHNYWEGYCEFRSEHLPEEQREAWQAEFSAFDGTLRFLGGASCPGCRNSPPSEKDGWGCLEGCFIPACARERGVDFCAECDAFPCQKAREFFGAKGGNLYREWENGNRRIREVGAEIFFREMKDISHYIHYKKPE
jgi:hypothetical protein